MTESIRVAANPERIEIAPGQDPVSIAVSIFNATTIVDEFVITLIGVGEWLTFDGARVRLFPDTGDDTDLMVSIPDGSAVPAGERAVGVRVESASDPSIQETVHIAVVVSLVTGGESLTLEPLIVRGGSSGVMRATLKNPGSGPMQVTFSGEDPEGAVRFSFSPASLILPPFAEGVTLVTVSAPRPWRGPERSRRLVIRAQGPTAAVATEGTFVQGARRLNLVRVVLTLLGGGLLMVSAAGDWANGETGSWWDYREYAAELDLSPAGPDPPGGVLFLTSAGFAAIALGVLGILGLLTTRGGLTLAVGVLTLLLLVVWAFAPYLLETGNLELGSGFYVAIGGSVLFIIAGIVGSRSN